MTVEVSREIVPPEALLVRRVLDNCPKYQSAWRLRQAPWRGHHRARTYQEFAVSGEITKNIIKS